MKKPRFEIYTSNDLYSEFRIKVFRSCRFLWWTWIEEDWYYSFGILREFDSIESATKELLELESKYTPDTREWTLVKK